MKSYEEVTNNLLERRDRYVAERSRKRKRMMGGAISLCCCCLVAFMGVGIWQIGIRQSQSPVTLDSYVVGNNYSDDDKVEQQTTNSNGETSQSQNNPEQTNNAVAKNQIRILKIENLPDNSTEMLIALMGDDFIRMNRDEINEYYGVNIFPTVPSDLESKEDQAFGVFRRKATGELYWDSNKIDYGNEDYSRTLCVDVDKECVPFDFWNLFDDVQTRSMINNVEVGIAQTTIGELYAEFMYQNAGFRIFACGLTQDEFVSVIESIVE